MIYLDNAATTKVSDAAISAAVDAMSEHFGNPSSLHAPGIEGERLVETARRSVAQALGCDANEVFFTSGGTEGNNMAVLGAAKAAARRGKHIITTAVEHASVLEPVKKLEQEGWRVTYIKPDENCKISSDSVSEAVCEDTVLVSVMSVNNEVGAIQPIADICRAVRKKNAKTLIHTDGIQAFFKLGGKLCDTGADIITVSGHKIHAPKGIGAIYIKKGVRLEPQVYGGGQQKGIRSGTEPVPCIAALGAACNEWMENGDERRRNMACVLETVKGLLNEVSGVTVISGSDAPHILSVSVGSLPSEVIMRMLEQHGIYVSSGSACSKGRRSHVLRAMGVQDKIIDSAVRISVAHNTTVEDAYALKCALEEICKRG